MKKPWERRWGHSWGHTSLGWTKGKRWELGVWSLDSEPQGTFLGMESAWEGEVPRRGKFPRHECLSLTGTGTKTCLPSQPGWDRCDGLPCLLTGGQTVLSASSERLVLSSCTGRRARVTPGNSQQESPRTGGVQQRKAGSSGEGGRAPPPRVILRLAQVRVPGLDLVSPFPDVSRGPKDQQRATQRSG